MQLSGRAIGLGQEFSCHECICMWRLHVHVHNTFYMGPYMQIHSNIQMIPTTDFIQKSLPYLTTPKSPSFPFPPVNWATAALTSCGTLPMPNSLWIVKNNTIWLRSILIHFACIGVAPSQLIMLWNHKSRRSNSNVGQMDQNWSEYDYCTYYRLWWCKNTAGNQIFYGLKIWRGIVGWLISIFTIKLGWL